MEWLKLELETRLMPIDTDLASKCFWKDMQTDNYDQIF